MICRAKRCHNDAMPGNILCGYHDEMAEDGTPFDMSRPERKRYRSPEYLEQESQKKAALYAEKKAKEQVQRDHAREIIAGLIAKRKDGPARRLATAKKGSRRCQFHARYGDYCYIHRGMRESVA